MGGALVCGIHGPVRGHFIQTGLLWHYSADIRCMQPWENGGGGNNNKDTAENGDTFRAKP